MTDTPTPADLTRTVEAVRATAPLVQCLTNVVVSGFTANVLLAAGAAPAMVDNPHEAAVLAGVAGGVLVNLGTPFDDTVEAMLAAADAAGRGGRPWVLDPVAVGVLPWRSEVAARLLGLGPTIVRGNASEVLALAGGAGGRGVDSTDSPDAAAEAARHLAAAHATVVAVSGPVDLLTDGDRLVRVANGHPWLTRVTGVGCALGALMAACAAAADDPLTAAVTATAWMNLAGEAAAAASGGPGSFAVALVDHLDALDAADLAASVALG